MVEDSVLRRASRFSRRLERMLQARRLDRAVLRLVVVLGQVALELWVVLAEPALLLRLGRTGHCLRRPTMSWLWMSNSAPWSCKLQLRDSIFSREQLLEKPLFVRCVCAVC